jgi:oligopeptide/dipeptide ABC transporter ATP-binding protein
VPVPDAARERSRPRRVLSGELSSALAPPAGCVFHTRCPLASAECRESVRALREITPGHLAACV